MSRKKKQKPEDGTKAGAETSKKETSSKSKVTDDKTSDAEQSPAEESSSAEESESEKSVEEKIDELNSEVKTANDRYLRLMAEFDNYKKRTSREYERMVESANEKLMVELTSVLDTFELALKTGENATEHKSFFEGIKLIFAKFDGVLTTNGLTPFAKKGEEFDPQLHDALMKTPHEEIPEDHITEIYEKGYCLKERVIKHARVIVSAGKPDESAKKNDKTE